MAYFPPSESGQRIGASSASSRHHLVRCDKRIIRSSRPPFIRSFQRVPIGVYVRSLRREGRSKINTATAGQNQHEQKEEDPPTAHHRRLRDRDNRFKFARHRRVRVHGVDTPILSLFGFF